MISMWYDKVLVVSDSVDMYRSSAIVTRKGSYDVTAGVQCPGLGLGREGHARYKIQNIS